MVSARLIRRAVRTKTATPGAVYGACANAVTMKTPAFSAGVGKPVTGAKGELLTILLDARRAQSGKTVLVDRVLPGEEFLDGQRVAAARLFEG
jgi:hypothetical protein